jgi:hypothetical protein
MFAQEQKHSQFIDRSALQAQWKRLPLSTKLLSMLLLQVLNGFWRAWHWLLQGLALKVKRSSSSVALYTSPLPPLGVEAKQVI